MGSPWATSTHPASSSSQPRTGRSPWATSTYPTLPTSPRSTLRVRDQKGLMDRSHGQQRAACLTSSIYWQTEGGNEEGGANISSVFLCMSGPATITFYLHFPPYNLTSLNYSSFCKHFKLRKINKIIFAFAAFLWKCPCSKITMYILRNNNSKLP